MALATPTNLQPVNAEAGIRLDDRLQLQWSKISGGGTLVDIQVAIYTDAGATALAWDGLLRPVLAGQCGDGWMDIYPAIVGLALGTTYYWRVRVRDNAAATSSWSSVTSFTTAAAPLPASTWLEAA